VEKVLARFIGSEVGINWREPGKSDAATLLAVGVGWFTVRPLSQLLTLHYNTGMVMMASEGQFKITRGGAPGKSTVGLLLVMNTLVIPGTSFWVGVEF
jgi:hypothetical protein